MSSTGFTVGWIFRRTPPTTPPHLSHLSALDEPLGLVLADALDMAGAATSVEDPSASVDVEPLAGGGKPSSAGVASPLPLAVGPSLVVGGVVPLVVEGGDEFE